MLACLLFLTSGTAVEVLGLRVSDFAVLGFVLLLGASGPVLSRDRLGLVVVLLFLGSSVAISSFIQSINVPLLFDIGLRNALAISLGLLSVFLLLLMHGTLSVISVAKHYSRICLAVCLSLYLFQYFYGIPSWIADVEVPDRFSAISVNPNQLALFLLPLPFFSAFCFLAGVIGRREMMGLVLFALGINLAVLGKALFVAWFFSLLLLYLVGWRLTAKGMIRRGFLTVRVVVCSVVAVVVAPLFFRLYTGDIAGGQDEQGETRVALWINGLSAWSEAFLFGHGSGHYSGIDGLYEGMEAHNLFIDWVAAYGVLGVMPLILFFGVILFSAWRGDKLLFAFVFALSIQMMFHFYARQPVFWVWWTFAFILARTLRDNICVDVRQRY